MPCLRWLHDASVTTRLTAARHAVVRACRAGLPTTELLESVAESIRAAVPFDACCLGAVDPETTMFGTSVGIGLDDKTATGFFENEYGQQDFSKYASITLRRPPLALLSVETGGVLQRSRRYRELLRPRGLEHEVRWCCVDGESPWGAGALLRRAGEDDFTADETALLTATGPHIGRALRTALLLARACTGDLPHVPGVVVLDPGGRIDSLTGSAVRWMRELGGDDNTLPIAVRAVAGRFRAGRNGHVPAELHVRTANGDWLSLHAAAMSGRVDGLVAVIIQPSRPIEVVPILLESHGLSTREREVALLTLQGLTTKLIARELGISMFTAQDHLKSVFIKLQVPGRKELAARVLFGYTPRDELAQAAAGSPRDR